MDSKQKFVELSHTVENGMVTYKGLPAPIISDYLSREASKPHYTEGISFQIGKIEMVANTGTYVDAPFHRYADGKDLSDLPLLCSSMSWTPRRSRLSRSGFHSPRPWEWPRPEPRVPR